MMATRHKLDWSIPVPFGKFARRKLSEIDTRELASYIDWQEEQAAKKGQPMRPDVIEFIERASKYLADLENASMDQDVQ